MAGTARAQLLTADLEIKLVENAGSAWQTINLENTYTDAIVVCSYRLPSISSNDAVTRIRNITANSFDLRVQQFETSSAVTASDVFCVISDEGAYDIGGLRYEARKVLSDGTSGQTVPNNWTEVNMEDVTSSVTQNYTRPAILGQVMSFNDPRASVFWASNCIRRNNHAFQNGPTDRACVGKHIGIINSTRAPETLGYFVVESSTGNLNNIRFAAAIGADIVEGTANSPPFVYNVSGDFDIGIVTQAGEDGGNGGWAVFYGADALPNNQIHLAIEEETVAGDTSRTHTAEQVMYWIFDIVQLPQIEAAKTVDVFSGSATPYAIPGTDVIYEIAIENTGDGQVDEGTIFLLDAIPPEVTFFNGDIDDGGPETDVVIAIDTNSGLTFDPNTDLGFSNGSARPSSMADCSYSPISGYDPDVTFICFAPQGSMNEGVIDASRFALRFRAMVE